MRHRGMSLVFIPAVSPQSKSLLLTDDEALGDMWL